MFIDILPTVSETGNNSKCPLMGEGLNKPWYIHTMDYYSAIKRNKLLIHALIWMNLINIMLSEKVDTKEHILCGFHLHRFRTCSTNLW